MLIDSHAHVIADDRASYPLNPGDLSAAWYVDAPVSAERFLGEMSEAGVRGAVLVQAYGAYRSNNAYATDCAQAHPKQFVSVVVVEPGSDSADRLSYWVTERAARGVRLLVNRPSGSGAREEPDMSPADPLHAIWKRAGELAVPVCINLDLRKGHRNWLLAALKQFRGSPVILDHCGLADFSDGPPFARAKDLLALAASPEVHLKISSRVLGQGRKHGFDPRALVNRLAREFGAERLMWASNYSASHELAYAEYAELARFACSQLGPSEREFFQAGSALRFWPGLGE